MIMSLAVAPVEVAMTAAEMLSAITTGTTTYVVLAVAAVTVLAMVMETIEVAVAAATTGAIMPVTVVELAMASEVVVVTGVAVTMREEVISPLETIPEFL